MTTFFYTIRVRVAGRRGSTYFDLANIEAINDLDAVDCAAQIARDEFHVPLAYARYSVIAKQPITNC